MLPGNDYIYIIYRCLCKCAHVHMEAWEWRQRLFLGCYPLFLKEGVFSGLEFAK